MLTDTVGQEFGQGTKEMSSVLSSGTSAEKNWRMLTLKMSRVMVRCLDCSGTLRLDTIIIPCIRFRFQPSLRLGIIWRPLFLDHFCCLGWYDSRTRTTDYSNYRYLGFLIMWWLQGSQLKYSTEHIRGSTAFYDPSWKPCSVNSSTAYWPKPLWTCPASKGVALDSTSWWRNGSHTVDEPVRWEVLWHPSLERKICHSDADKCTETPKVDFKDV